MLGSYSTTTTNHSSPRGRGQYQSDTSFRPQATPSGGPEITHQGKDSAGSPAFPFADGGRDRPIRGGHIRSEFPGAVGESAGRHSPQRTPTWADPCVACHVVPRVTFAGMAAPSMKERQACWGARDLYWRCLDDNAEDAARCQKLRSSFEASCPQQWVSPAGLQHAPACTLTPG